MLFARPKEKEKVFLFSSQANNPQNIVDKIAEISEQKTATAILQLKIEITISNVV